MKMFLTRLGFGSKMVITGDPSQIDLPKGVKSGLIAAQHTLQNVDGIAMTILEQTDVVRHPLVQKIIQAYDHINE
jgi:phosphate starvation-inducible PhoH-like protein